MARDANVHGGLRLATLGIGVLELFFAAADLVVTQPRDLAVRIATADVLLGLAFLAAYFLLRAGAIPVRHAHPFAGVLALLIIVDTVHDAHLLADPQQALYLMLIVLGAGSIFLSTAWLLVVAVGALAGWSPLVAIHDGRSWMTFGLVLFAACVLAIVVHAVRQATFDRMETLRAADARRQEQLEIREQALESAVRALQASEERWRRLVEGAPDGFLVIARGRILYANPTAVRMFGARDAAQLEGMDPLRLVRSEDADHVRGRIALVESGRATEPAEIGCVRLDGRVFEVEVIGQPITYLGEPADQTVIRDITDRKRAEAERHVARERLAEIARLREMDRVKTQFVNAISHELRTPLTPIKVQLHLLRAAKELSQVAKATDMLDRNVARLSGLVDELLEVARIQAGTLRIAKVDVDLGGAVAQAFESYVDVARRDGIVLTRSIEDGLVVVGDATRLQQVVYNLLSNSFKFTRRGGRIEVRVEREGPDAVVSVRDTGAGIAPEDVGRLFEPFTQVHDTMQMTHAGTGLGLYICRGLVEGHAGRIWAESAGPGQGARFAFAVPLRGAGA